MYFQFQKLNIMIIISFIFLPKFNFILIDFLINTINVLCFLLFSTTLFFLSNQLLSLEFIISFDIYIDF